MTNESTEEPKTPQETTINPSHHPRRGRAMAGGLLVLVGLVFLARELGTVFPHWLFTWPVFLIVLGIFLGAKHNFNRGGWWIVSLVGAIFLIDKLTPEINIGHLIWPSIIILIGLVFIFKPKRKWDGHWDSRCNDKWKDKYGKNSQEKYTDYKDMNASHEDYIESTSIFGGVKKNIISKDFKGGEIVCVFGGAEVNMMQADINGRAELEIVNVFAGTKLLLPAHWEVQHHEMVAILGGIEDKRPPYSGNTVEERKVLVIKGTSIFGGIDIRSY
ncbi:MAG: LiaF transmembrane domain-containing protein [Bacteroidia bacterium]